MQVPPILSICSTEIKNLGKRNEFGTLWDSAKKHRLINLWFWVLHLTSRQSTCFIKKYHTITLGKSSSLNPGLFTPGGIFFYSQFHLCSPISQTFNSKLKCIGGFYSFESTFIYIFYLLDSLSSFLKWVSQRSFLPFFVVSGEIFREIVICPWPNHCESHNCTET
jgi:hypothetical protein